MSWYQSNARDLPWRKTRNPYLIWISEIMLQQTQVRTVIPYFQRWTNYFPDMQSLVNANDDEVLKVWEGLGYYSRARNIKKTAEILCSQFNCVMPETINELNTLPGIGDYIAGAIASIAFGLMEPALEANGIRVISRLFNFNGMVSKTASKNILKGYLRELLPNGKAGDFNQAVMDLGAMVCQSVNPICKQCPIRKECLAFAKNTQKNLPILKERPIKPHFDVVAAIILINDTVLIDKRPKEGLLGGMWEFPGGKIEKGENHSEAIIREIQEEIGITVNIGELFGIYKHAYTHFSVTVFSYFVEIESGKPRALEVEKIAWVNISDLWEYPMGKVDRNISNDLENRMNK